MDAVNDTNRTARLPFYNGERFTLLFAFDTAKRTSNCTGSTQDDDVQGRPSMGYTGNSGLRSIGSNSRTGGGVLNGLAGLQWHQPNQIFRSAKPNFHQKYRI